MSITPHLRSGAVTRGVTPVLGQGRRPGGDTPRPKPEAKGGRWEELPHAPKPEAKGGGCEDQHHIQ